MSPSKIARPSTTAYCTACVPNVTPVRIAVRTSSEDWSSGLSELLVFLDRDVLFFAALRLDVSAMTAPSIEFRG